jgi:hypothetical protein
VKGFLELLVRLLWFMWGGFIILGIVVFFTVDEKMWMISSNIASMIIVGGFVLLVVMTGLVNGLLDVEEVSSALPDDPPGDKESQA